MYQYLTWIKRDIPEVVGSDTSRRRETSLLRRSGRHTQPLFFHPKRPVQIPQCPSQLPFLLTHRLLCSVSAC